VDGARQAAAQRVPLFQIEAVREASDQLLNAERVVDGLL
jgi:hypothetical protein